MPPADGSAFIRDSTANQTAEVAPSGYQQSPPLTFSAWLAGVISRWRIVMLGLLAAIAVAVLAVVLIPPVYTARASFVANTTSGGLRMPASLGRLSGALGGAVSQLGLGEPSDPSESPAFYAQLVGSRELRTRLLSSRFANPRTDAPSDSAELLSILRIRTRDRERRMELALRALERSVRVGHDDRTSVVFLAVSTEWRELSAAVANRMLDLVAEFNREQRSSRAGSRREFLETRVGAARAELAAAETRQRIFQEQNRSWRSSPMLVLQAESIQREVDRTTTLYLTLQQQLEAARIEEVNNAALITVIDSAVPPRKAAWPRYGLLGMSTLMAGLVIGVVLAGLATVLADWRRRNPESASQLKLALRKR